jgi:hypothetical protein
MRREWPSALIKEVHADSGATYGARRVHAELTKVRGIREKARLEQRLVQIAQDRREFDERGYAQHAHPLS